MLSSSPIIVGGCVWSVVVSTVVESVVSVSAVVCSVFAMFSDIAKAVGANKLKPLQ